MFVCSPMALSSSLDMTHLTSPCAYSTRRIAREEAASFMCYTCDRKCHNKGCRRETDPYSLNANPTAIVLRLKGCLADGMGNTRRPHVLLPPRAPRPPGYLDLPRAR